MSIESVMPSNHLALCRPLLLLPSIVPSIRVFSNELALCIRWPKYWSCSLNISPSNEYSGLISFRICWFDLLNVQGTLKSLLQHHSSRASVLWHSVFFHIHTHWKNHSFDSAVLVLEKTLESPLDCKEMQPVHPKGDYSWVFIAKTDAEAETPILWPPQAKS